MNIMDIFVSIGFKFDGAGVQQAENSMRKFEKTAESINFMGFLAKITAVRYAFNAVAWAAQSAIGVFTNFIQAAGEKQRTVISFEVLTGSPAKAKKVLEELWDLATKTPFTVPDVEKNAMMLNAMGFAPEDLRQTMSMLGDITAGLPNATLERLALNLGQVKATTYLTGRELRDFANAGLPMLAELQKLEKFKKMSLGEIRDAISDRQVAYEDVEQVFINLTSAGGRFFQMSSLIMKTVPGMWSNLVDQVILLQRSIGEGLTPTALSLMEAVMAFFNKYKGDIADVISESLNAILLALQTIGLELLGAGRLIVWIISLLGEYKDIIKSLSAVVTLFFTGFALKGVGVGFAALFHKLHVLYRLIRLWVSSGIILMAIGLITKLTAAIKAGRLAAAMGAAPWILLGLAVVGVLLAIQDLYKYFTDKENTDTVFGKLAEISPLAETVLEMFRLIFMALLGIILALFGFTDVLGNVFTTLDINGILDYWGKFYQRMKDAFDTWIESIDKSMEDSWLWKVLRMGGKVLKNTAFGMTLGYIAEANYRPESKPVDQLKGNSADSPFSGKDYYTTESYNPKGVTASEPVVVQQTNNIYVKQPIKEEFYPEMLKQFNEAVKNLNKQIPGPWRPN